VVSGAQVNYARQVLRHVQPAHAAGMPAVIADNEQGQVSELGWPDLQRQVAALALHLRAQGVGKGDRVAAYLPNVPEAIVALLAVASLGAVWSVCAPDMGTAAVLDRFQQIEPKALIAVDGVYYAGKPLDRSAVLQELRAQLPTLRMWWCCAAACGPGGGRQRRSGPGAGPRRCGHRCFRARMAAVRPPAVDRLFQRHHRPAQAHRPRPWRHGAGGAVPQGPAQRRGLQL
jgi:hypothetical protein